MPLKGTFQLVSPAAPTTEISNLRLDQDNSHHRGPPIKVQLLQSSLILWHRKSKAIQPIFKTRQFDWTKLQLNYR